VDPELTCSANCLLTKIPSRHITFFTDTQMYKLRNDERITTEVNMFWVIQRKVYTCGRARGKSAAELPTCTAKREADQSLLGRDILGTNI
jgi:hypothetical protein